MANFTLRTSSPPELSRRTRTRLAELGFSEQGVRDRLALDSMSQLSEASKTRAAHLFPLETPQDHLITLFIFGQPVPKESISSSLCQVELEFLILSGLLFEPRHEILLSNVFLLPFRSLFIASDRHDYGQSDEVWTPSVQTFTTEKFLPRQAKHSLDIATGSGILALLMSGHSEAVHGIDINPRAIEFARFNAWFNELLNISFETVPFSTFAGRTRETFDVITGVLPDLMVGSVRRNGPISRVVSDGIGLLSEIYNNLDGLLEPGGICVFWHGITASRQSIRDCFENEVIKKEVLPVGYEVIVLSAIKGGQETGVFLLRKRSSKLPPLFSRLSPSLGITDPFELFEITNARRWFHSLQPQERKDTRLRIREGLLLAVEHRFQNGHFLGQGYQIGRYRFSSDVFDLLQMIDGERTFSEIIKRFLRNKLGDKAVAESEERQLLKRTICDLVDKGIVGPGSEPLSQEVIDKIRKHMNEHHADAVLTLAQKCGNCAVAEAAQVLSIDSQGMDLTAQTGDAAVPIRITFDHVLKDAEDAKNTIIALVQNVGSEP